MEARLVGGGGGGAVRGGFTSREQKMLALQQQQLFFSTPPTEAAKKAGARFNDRLMGSEISPGALKSLLPAIELLGDDSDEGGSSSAVSAPPSTCQNLCFWGGFLTLPGFKFTKCLARTMLLHSASARIFGGIGWAVIWGQHA